MKKQYLSLKPLVQYHDLKRPVDWSREFGRQAPLGVEIGFGIGDYLMDLALRYPDHNFLGIENSWVAVRRTLRKIAQGKAGNIRLILVDAKTAFERLIQPQTVSRVYSLFPCPWPKKKHIKYRLYSGDFLKVLNSRLAESGEVQMVTDHQGYLEWVLEQCRETGFTTRWEKVWPKFDTKYEHKWQGKGQTQFYELILKKERHFDVPVKEDLDLNVYRLKSFNPDDFRPQNESSPRAIIFKEFLYDPKRQKGLVEVIVSEENIRQHFWTAIARHREEWRINVSEGSSVIPTEGVKRALELVYEASVLSCR